METKNKVLNAAKEIMLEKGLHNSTISEIAAKAEVTDSVIYHYFKNKQALLFSFIGEHMKEVLKELSEQLEGILEPMSGLSKMVWFHLHYNVAHKDYSLLLLFECRSNRDFYRHHAYNRIRQYAGIMLSILENGVKNGVFRDDLNTRLVRDIIFGALDQETVHYILPQDLEYSPMDLQEIIKFISAMIEIRPAESTLDPDKSARIPRAAEKVFAEKSYYKSTISEIASLAAVGEGTVYECFKNKEDLLLSIPKMRLMEQIDSLNEVFVIKTPRRKLRRFILYLFFLNMTEPDFSRVFWLNVLPNPRFYTSKAYTIFRNYGGLVDELLEEGKKDGTVRSDVNNTIFKRLLFGGLSHIMLWWLILDQKSQIDKMKETSEAISLLESAVATECSFINR